MRQLLELIDEHLPPRRRVADHHGRATRLTAARERRSDMLLSTLRRFVEATGGEMHIVVSYPDGGPVELLVDEQ